ncbi:MAG: hypothetical protein HYS07_01085 [Chlamydiae bacterium]|nr:hypothetical protein [Chlamydiota bacterium]MBI3276514.1 hypothetical protein [Chlamydiota bacterium]
MERRRKYFIDKTIQLSFLKFVLILLLVVCGGFSFFLLRVNNYLTEYIVTSLEQPSMGSIPIKLEPALPQFKANLYQKDFQFLVEIYSAVLLLGLMVSFLTLRFTHRLAGPVFRMKTVLDRVIQGDYSPRIHLRKKDHLKELAEKLNILLETLDKKG